MSYITYKQADSRWGKKNYNGSSSMATAGCGPTSVAMLAYAVDGKTTPWDVAKYMQKHGYAIRNNGTAWAGIPAAMKHFGLTDVKNVEKMSDVFSYLSKGYCAVFLFRAGTRGNITWTTSGHYVAVTGYKVQNGNHYLYTRDSGGRDHTGWYAYETQMRGLIPQVWVGKVPTKIVPKPTGKYSGVIPVPTIKKGVKGDNVKNLQKFLNWYCKANMKVDGIAGGITCGYLKIFQATEGISDDGIYGKVSQSKANAYKAVAPKPKTKGQLIADTAKSCAWAYGTPRSKYKYPDGSPTSAFKKAIEKAYPDRSGWGKQTRAGASCDVFTGTCVRASGVDTKFPRGLDDQIPYLNKSDKFTKVGIKSASDLKAGDIIVYTKKKGGGHICIYVGSDKICEAGYVSKRYGCTTKLAKSHMNPTYIKNTYSFFGVFRAK